jgi:hypothetical protein
MVIPIVIATLSRRGNLYMIRSLKKSIYSKQHYWSLNYIQPLPLKSHIIFDNRGVLSGEYPTVKHDVCKKLNLHFMTIVQVFFEITKKINRQIITDSDS